MSQSRGLAALVRFFLLFPCLRVTHAAIAPRYATLIVRDITLGLAATVVKQVKISAKRFSHLLWFSLPVLNTFFQLDDDVTVLGLAAPLEAGVHKLQISIAVDIDGEITEVLSVDPKRV